MNIVETLALVNLQLEKELTKKDLAEVLGISRAYLYRIGELSNEQIKIIEDSLGVKLTSNIENTQNLPINDGYVINYWDGSKKCKQKIINPNIDDIVLDLQLIVNEYKLQPENLKIIAMPGDEMDGGCYPLKNNDILLIDISKTDLAESGVYFVTTHDNTRVYVRRLMEVMDDPSIDAGDKAISSTVDNPLYQKVNKIISEKRAKAMGLKIIGKVIKNLSFRI